MWQTLVGAWPLSADRAVAYVEKATREAKDRTSWTEPVPEFDEAVAAFVRGVLGDERIRAAVAQFVAGLAPAWRATALAQKAVQLTVPGVADTYQGTELFDLSLVDPDNRRPVDWDARRRMLAVEQCPRSTTRARPSCTWWPGCCACGGERPSCSWPTSSYAPLEPASGRWRTSAADRVVTVAPTRALHVERTGWGDDAVELPAGSWTDVLTGATRDGRAGGAGRAARHFPVAVLLRD